MLKVRIDKGIWCRYWCVGSTAGMSPLRRNQGLPHDGPSWFQRVLNQTHCRTQRSPFPAPASPHLWVWVDLSGVHEWGGVWLGGRRADVLMFVSVLISWIYFPQKNLPWPFSQPTRFFVLVFIPFLFPHSAEETQ